MLGAQPIRGHWHLFERSINHGLGGTGYPIPELDRSCGCGRFRLDCPAATGLLRAAPRRDADRRDAALRQRRPLVWDPADLAPNANNPLEALTRELVVAPPLAAVIVPGAPADPADVVLRARVRDGAVVSCVSEPRPRRLSLAPGRCLEWPDPLREAKRLLLR